MRLRPVFALLFLFLLIPLSHAADIPAALAEWRDWVLADHPEHTCHRLLPQPEQRRCRWPGELTLAVGGQGARFGQRWTLAAEGWVTLPGDRDHWPQAVTVNGRPAPVLERGGAPALHLPRGGHTVAGTLRWRAPPQSLPIPAETALLALSVDGQAVAWPQREGGRLWLRGRESSAAQSGDTVKVEVFRLLADDIPRRLDSVLRLSVAGEPRELRLGRLLLADSVAEHFDSPLPARIEEDGSLRVQVRPGTWELRLRARLLGDQNRFRIARAGEDWPAQEIWSFAARPELRRAQVSGPAGLDPSQLDLPKGFENLPTWLMEADSELVLAEQFRGDAAPAANELALVRTVWLDFEGGGATLRDRINGTLQRGWRLDAQPALQLGRVSVNGEPQLVTRLAADGAAGVELRQRQVDIDAVSRVDRLGELDAVGWQSDFNRVEWQLQLPPGWKLWHVAGPDSVERSWLSQWDLWDIFLALLLVGALQRLLGWGVAALAATAVLLAWHEPDSPLLWLLPLLALLALLPYLPAGWPRRWLQRSGWLFTALLVLVLIGFAVDQVRQGIYPQLERGYAIGVDTAATAAAAPAVSDSSLEEMVVTQQKLMRSAVVSAARPAPVPRYQPAANVQTGPGVPTWSWQQVRLGWSGPVQAQQSLDLIVTGPWSTRLLKFLAVLLVAALSAVVVRALWRVRRAADEAPPAAALAPTLLLMLTGPLLWAPAPVQAADYPSPELLEQLGQRLLKAPDCAPACAALEAVSVELQGERLRLRLRVGAAAQVALPLPHSAQWRPHGVRVDGEARDALLRDGNNTLLALEPGRHDVLVDGVVEGDSVTLQFPLPAHNVAVRAEGWTVSGLSGARLAASSLQLQRQARGDRRDTLLADAPPPFAEVRRELQLDLDWQVVTTVARVAPAQGAMTLRVPLLPGESVVSDGIAVEEGHAVINLGAQQASQQWRGVLPRGGQLALGAAETAAWVEQWNLRASPRWHVEASGLVPIRSEGGLRRWRPWPGETLTLTPRQPQPVGGPTTTVERASLRIEPGTRGSEAVLELTVASSVGGDFRVALQEPGELRTARLNGADITHASDDGALALPLVPGDNRAEIRWQLARGVQLATATPALQLDGAATNLTLAATLPHDRWPLWVSGPRIGPAMLYWGVLVVIVGLALGLAALVKRGRLSIPLGPLHWLLLGIGMSTVDILGSAVVVLWFFALEARRRGLVPRGRLGFNFVQIALAIYSVVALATLVAVIPQSLLAAPDMQVTGNGSHNYFYQWYQDRSAALLPQAQVVSVPLWAYRVAMLVWSLWLVFALLRWIPWGWHAYAEDGLWRPRPAAPPPSETIAPEEKA